MVKHCALNNDGIKQLLELSANGPVNVTIGKPIKYLKEVTIKYLREVTLEYDEDDELFAEWLIHKITGASYD